MKFLNQFVCGDALATLKEIPTNSVDLVVTSPPYNLRSGGFMQSKTVSKWKGAALTSGYESFSDNMPKEDYNLWQREILDECMRVLKDDGAIFYNTKWIIRDGLMDDRHDIIQGFPVRQIIIWQRAGSINFNIRFFCQTYEVIYMIAKKDFKLVKRASGLTDVWVIPQKRGSWHPAAFPLELAERCIRSTDAKIILDPFGGSGTVAAAAKKLGRNFIYIDISQKYTDAARASLGECLSLQ